MARRRSAERRRLQLWTAGWLALFLLAGLLWVGQLAGEWLVLLVPVLWAGVAVRRRPRGPVAGDGSPRPPG